MLNVKGQRQVRETNQAAQTHLHMDLDRERDALLQLLGFLIEVFAELPDGYSSLDRNRKREEREK